MNLYCWKFTSIEKSAKGQEGATTKLRLQRENDVEEEEEEEEE